MSDENEFTTIRISFKTKKRFEGTGRYGQNADELLKQLVSFWERYKDVINR